MSRWPERLLAIIAILLFCPEGRYFPAFVLLALWLFFCHDS